MTGDEHRETTRADAGQCDVARHQLKKMVTPVAKRKAVAHLMEVHQISQRRACDVLQVDRSSVRYLSRRGDDADLRDAIKRVSRYIRGYSGIKPSGWQRLNLPDHHPQAK
ncbi:MAG: hypothetical protein KUG69_12070 [Marinosulfonomonas sp.]|nr:hypothetical protein [Marinosulfonomonas sp.]